MLERIETLAALAESKTMRLAGQRMRVSQSTVSKRIAALEAEVGEPLVERIGRNVALTPAAFRLLDRALPLLRELQATLVEEVTDAPPRVVMGMSESILSSWGSRVLARAEADLATELVVHAHRSPVAVEWIRAGEYTLGLCAGVARAPRDLIFEHVADEPMVIVPAGLEPLKLPRRRALDVLTIETHSATWSSLAKAAAGRFRPTRTVENFACAAQMAREGLGHGLVPLGVTRALGIPRASLVVPPGNLSRPVALVARKTTWHRPAMATVFETLVEHIASVAAGLTC